MNDLKAMSFHNFFPAGTLCSRGTRTSFVQQLKHFCPSSTIQRGEQQDTKKATPKYSSMRSKNLQLTSYGGYIP